MRRTNDEIVLAARDVVSDHAKSTGSDGFFKDKDGNLALQGPSAVDVDGNEVAPHSDLAVKWSLAGAICNELFDEETDALSRGRRLRKILVSLI